MVNWRAPPLVFVIVFLQRGPQRQPTTAVAVAG
jgi:hypothetical protein